MVHDRRRMSALNGEHGEAGPSGVNPSRANQSATASTVTGQSADNEETQDEDEDSPSLLQDHPLLGLNSSRNPSQPRTVARVDASDGQSGSVDPPSDQSLPVLPPSDDLTRQPPPPEMDEEEASEVMHAPHQRRRMALDSLPDEEEQPQPQPVNLVHLLQDQTNEAVLASPPAPRARIYANAPSTYGIDSDSDDGSDTVVIESDTDYEDDEQMEVVTLGVVASAPLEGRPAGLANATPVLQPAASDSVPLRQAMPVPVPPTTAPASTTPSQRPDASVPTTSSTLATANDSMQDFRSPKRIVTAATTSKSDTDITDADSDDDSQSCIICYEPWTNSGDHRLSSLKCGHLFGHSCILKWLRNTSNQKCPQCNAKAKKGDVRIIYAKSLRTIDTSERDRALDELKKEKEIRRKAEIDMAQTNLRFRMAVMEVNRLKAQISAQQDQLRKNSGLHTSAAGQSASSSGRQGPEDGQTPHGQYTLDKTIQISQNGNCRVMGFDQFHSALVVSMPSPNQLFPGFGVKKVSAVDLRCTQYVPIHTAMIRGLTFNGRNDGQLLTASADKTVKITSLVSNSVVQTYKTDAPVWSCAWNTTDVNYIYAGLQNGAILIFDTRQVNGEVEKLTLDNSRCPIVSLNYVPKAADRALGCSGLLTASLGGMAFWEQTSDIEFKPHLLQMDGICTSLSFNNTSRHCLASFRPNKNHNSVRHVMCELKNERNDTSNSGEVVCYPVQTFYGGRTMKVLTRSVLYPRPDKPDQLYACCSDEATSSALVWDTTSGNQLQKLMVNATVLDVCPFAFNRCNLLAALTEKQVKLYTWQPAK